jgi:isopentenyldiphosphate isomerase
VPAPVVESVRWVAKQLSDRTAAEIRHSAKMHRATRCWLFDQRGDSVGRCRGRAY